MPQQLTSSVENNFTKGLVTDSTGLNFPENASTDTDNCIYTLIGDVTRREGIDKEVNYATAALDTTGVALTSYKWNNAGGDGETQLVVTQVGSTLYFYLSSEATVATPLSARKLTDIVDLLLYAGGSSSVDVKTQECQYADGNGYLFVYHPACSPVCVTYSSGVITSTSISIKIRDFVGTKETPVSDVTTRPQVLNNDHKYNLLNQGWTSGSGSKSGLSLGDNPNINLGPVVFTMASTGLGFVTGDIVSCFTSVNHVYHGVYIPAGTSVMSGAVTGYSGTTLNVTITDYYDLVLGANLGPYIVSSSGAGYIDTWHTATANYPSNSDVWWYFKNSSDVFDPATTIANITLASARAPQGHYILDAFNQNKSTISGIPSLTTVSTNKRPRTGCWFQGRVWYTGVDATQAASGTSDFYSWTENIYFSQVVETLDDVGNCYQVNDPTSQQLNSLLPTDGGVIVIPGAGSIYKLFPIANGLIVFAANGVWFITGSQGIGFAANDYTITKLSSIQSVSSTSFVDVLGLPYFWNDDGIYQVTPQQGGSLTVQSITVGIIETFYSSIPQSSKRKARGAYNPIEFTIQWIYKDTEAVDITDSYKFDRIINFNVYNKAFYPYSITTTPSAIASILYVAGPGGSGTPTPCFKYLATTSNSVSFADEHDSNYVDWASVAPVEYNSYFITGYKLRGQAIRKFQLQYLQIWYRTNDGPTSYNIQGIWDYANSGNTGRWSSIEQVNTGLSDFDTRYKRHKIRGSGYSLQFKLSSVAGQPFDIQGWAVIDTVNQSA